MSNGHLQYIPLVIYRDVAFLCFVGLRKLISWYDWLRNHNSDVIMGAMESQITSVTIVYSTVYSGADQRKHQSSASLAFVRGIHRWPVNSPEKGQNVSIWWRHHVTRYLTGCPKWLVTFRWCGGPFLKTNFKNSLKLSIDESCLFLIFHLFIYILKRQTASCISLTNFFISVLPLKKLFRIARIE